MHPRGRVGERGSRTRDQYCPGNFLIGVPIVVVLGYQFPFSLAALSGVLQFPPVVGPSLVVALLLAASSLLASERDDAASGGSLADRTTVGDTPPLGWIPPQFAGRVRRTPGEPRAGTRTVTPTTRGAGPTATFDRRRHRQHWSLHRNVRRELTGEVPNESGVRVASPVRSIAPGDPGPDVVPGSTGHEPVFVAGNCQGGRDMPGVNDIYDASTKV